MVPTCRGAGERKTKQVLFVLRPSEYEEFRKVANMQQVSCNELINRWVHQHVQEHQDLIKKYNELHPVS